MDYMVENIQKQIKAILSHQGSVPKPSPDVCQSIANMRDLIDLQVSIQTDWRKNSPEPGSPYRFNSNTN